MSLDLETVERETAPEPTASVVWLHGLGADGYDFDPIVPQLRLPGGPEVRYVFPHAPVQPVTINGGVAMRAWYDIVDLRPGAPQDVTGIRRSAEAVRGLVEREIGRGIPASRIVLAGFSQGGAIALHTGLRFGERLAGIIGLSTYLPLKDTLKGEASDANRETPIFMAHGTLDPVVPALAGQASQEFLAGCGYEVSFTTYAMPHAVCPQEIEDIRRWLGRVPGPLDPA